MSLRTRIATVLRKLRSFWTGYLWWQKLLFPPVFVALGLARAAVLNLPLRFYAFVLGNRLKADHKIVQSAEHPMAAVRISQVIRASSGVTPWDSNCLPQAIVAALLLRCFRIGYVVHLGLKRGKTAVDDGLEAHAWTMAGGQPVTGFQASHGMAKVATFVWPNEVSANKQ